MMQNNVRAAAQVILRRWLAAARDCRGNSTVEFAFVLPVLLTILFAITKLGITMNNYLELTNGVRSGARTLSISRVSTTPRTDTVNKIYGSAPNLTQGSFTITTKVAGVACTTDGGCQTALGAAPGGVSSVTVTYPCDLKIMGITFVPSCTLTSSTTERIE